MCRFAILAVVCVAVVSAQHKSYYLPEGLSKPVTSTKPVSPSKPISTSKPVVNNPVHTQTCKKSGILPLQSGACESAYIQCVAAGTQAIRFECASSDTRYDVATESCLMPEFVRACGGRPTTTTPVPQQDPTPIPFTFNCKGKPDLDFPNPNKPCSSLYVSCSGEESFIRECSGNLKFDIISRMCLEEAYVKTCHGSATTLSPLAVTLRDVPDSRCASRTDGLYEVKSGACSQAILFCFGGFSQSLLCPDGLKFDMISQFCLEEQWVRSCGGTSTTTESTPIRQADPVDPTLLAFCAAKPDGNYPAPSACSATYITCSGSRPSVSECPGELRYSAADDQCKKERDVLGCAQFDSTADVCGGRVNGFYPHPSDCHKFIFCDNRQPVELECAGQLVFDEKHMKCDKAEKVMAGCGLMQPADVPEFSCANRPLGFHVNEFDCGAYYLCEEDGSAWEFTCEAGYAFDKPMEECRPAATVADCMPKREPEMLPFCKSQVRDGVFESPESCASGVICLQEVAFELTCGKDRPEFDRYLLQCTKKISAEAKCQV